MLKFLIFIIPLFSQLNANYFVDKPERLAPFCNNKNVVLIASTGRSGSTMLTDVITNSTTNYAAVKTHICSISPEYTGKILFIFSNPDKAAESALHQTLIDEKFGHQHFMNMEGSDRYWLDRQGKITDQTVEDNFLSYDALGCFWQLLNWLLVNRPCYPLEANVLAIKYENLWDPDTVANIRSFLNLSDFSLPAKIERGYSEAGLDERELLFRKTYNLGTPENPLYEAYDQARKIWQEAPPYQYLSTHNQAFRALGQRPGDRG